jgi:hypothetical protein
MLFGVLVLARSLAPTPILATPSSPVKLSAPRPAILSHRWIDAVRRPAK